MPPAPPDGAEPGTRSDGPHFPPEQTTLAPDSPARSDAPASALPSVPGYELLGELGRGAMGVVYHGRHLRLGRPVALKMILSGGHASDADRARFRTEAEAAARVRHANVVPIYDVGEHDGRPYLAMEYVEGGSLAARVGDAPLPAAEAATLVRTLAGAVQAAHAARVVHRDLKPANVLLAADGTPKITDFGLAKKLDESGQTATGAVLGTPSYMAPEQAAGKGERVGPGTDVWALGAMLYKLLTGRPPFQAATMLDTLMQVLEQEPVAPRRLNPKVPRDLETVCLKCLEKDPGRRYVSAAALAEDLRRFEAGEPVLAVPAGPLTRAAKWARRRPAVAGLLLTVAAVAAAGAAGVLWAYGRAVDAADRAREESVRANAEAARADGAAANARRDAAVAKMAVRQFRQSLYLSHIRGARAELAAGDPAGAGRVLDQTEFALRGWEYTHLRRRAEGTPLILRGESGVLSVAFSPDGARLVTARENGEVRVTDTRTGRELISLLVPGGLTSVALSPDGSRLLIGSRTQSARVWDFRTATEILALRGYAEEILSVAYSPDGSRFATGSKDKTARIWDAHTGAELLTLRGGPSTQRGDVAVLSVAFSPDGRRLAAALDGETVRVWDARTGRELLAPVNRDAVATALAFSPDGTRLALLSAADDLIRVRDSTAPTGEEVVFGGHGEPVVAAAFGPDGTRLATGDEDGKVRLWDPRSGAELFTLSVHTGAVRALSFSPDGDRLATGSRDGSVRLWDSRSAPEALALQSSNNSVLVAAFSHSDSVLAVAFSPDGRRLATGSRDNTARVWDARTGLELFTLAGHGNDVTAVAFSPDGTRVATSSDDKTMRLWDAVTGRLQFVLNGHGGRVTGVAFSPDGTRLATASWDLSFRVWDARSGDKLLDIGGVGAEHGHSAALTAVTYSPDGSRLATTAQDGSARVWDARTGTELLCLRHPEIVTAVAFSPDGSRLATGSEDNAARLWDGRTGEELFVLRGHGSAVASVSFSPDGSRLVTGSADNTARLWDVRTGAELLTLRGDGFRVNGVAFSPGGGQIAMACGKTVRIWDARSDRLAVPPSTPLAPFDAAKPWSAEDHARTVNLISWLVPALRTPGPYNPWVEGEDRRQAWAVTRHAVDAAVAVRRNDPFAAAFHLARVNELPVRWPADRVRRGLCRLWMGRRAEALADLAHPQLAGENDTSRLQWHALACLATGDRAGYRAACARRLTLFGPDPEPDWANDAAWCFCLGPGAAVDPGAVVRLAEKAVKADPRDWNAINTLGAALLRAGRPADAVGRLEESLRLGGGQEDTFNELFLVLAHHQLGHAAEARRWLQAAAAKMDGNRTPARVCGTLGAGPAGALAAAAALLADRPEPLAGKDDYILTKWLEMDVLRAEAEAALAGAGPRQ